MTEKSNEYEILIPVMTEKSNEKHTHARAHMHHIICLTLFMQRKIMIFGLLPFFGY